MKRTLIGICAVSVMALCHAEAAFAQNDAEIVVTAQKREERLIDVPLSITAITAQEVERRGISSIQDLSFAVPGLTMREDGPGSYTIFLRGIANASGTGPLVSVYEDESPLSLTGFDQITPVALDIQRIEVLKGPQGTLYGQGSAAGTIRYITNKVNLDAFEGSAAAEVYSVNTGDFGQKLDGVVNVPIVPGKLGLRVAGKFETGGGWIDQPRANITNGNGTDLVHVRAKLHWAPVDALHIEGTVTVHRAKTQLGLGYEEPDRTAPIAISTAEVLVPKEYNYTIYGLTMTYDFGFAELVSSTNYIDFDHRYPTAYTPRVGNKSFNVVEGNDKRWNNTEQFSQELRLASSGGGPLDWTVGAFYRDAKDKLFALSDFRFLGNITRDAPFTSIAFYKNYSLFGDISYNITDALKIGAGLRYFEDTQKSSNGVVVEGPQKFDSLDPRVFVSYALGKDANIYASVTKGFRSGGFNRGVLPEYEPEKILSYEIGAKAVILDGALSFEVAGFYTDYEDMVRRGLLLINGTFRSLTSNIGRVEVKGIEGGFTLYPGNGLTFSATGAYITSEVTEIKSTDAVNRVGDRTDYVPRVSFTISANQDFDWAESVPGFARLDLNYRDKVSYIDRSSFLASALPQMSDALTLINARVGANVGGTEIEAFVLNLLDQNKSIDPYQQWGNANRTRPRTIGLRVSRTF